MYNLLVTSGAWDRNHGSMDLGRILEFTSEEVIALVRKGGHVDFNKLTNLPCIFMSESDPRAGQQLVRVGYINNINVSGNKVLVDYTFDDSIPTLTNEILQELSNELDIVVKRGIDEFSRTHWSVKRIDLYRALLRNLQPRRQLPTVFRISDPERVEPTLISFMMPFSMEFQAVYDTVSNALNGMQFNCRRADNIWENPEIIQDIVSLIDHSKVVICDCSGRNPNVFYEIGIAHTLGREVILITRNIDDVPFDLRHLRVIQYHNNSEGLESLVEQITERVRYLTGTQN